MQLSRFRDLENAFLSQPVRHYHLSAHGGIVIGLWYDGVDNEKVTYVRNKCVKWTLH